MSIENFPHGHGGAREGGYQWLAVKLGGRAYAAALRACLHGQGGDWLWRVCSRLLPGCYARKCFERSSGGSTFERADRSRDACSVLPISAVVLVFTRILPAIE